VVCRPEHAPSLAVERASGGDLLIEVHDEAVRDHARLEVDTRLLKIKLVGGFGLRHLLRLELVTQIPADRDEAVEGTGPDIGAGVEVLGGQHVLRKDLPKEGALAAPGRIDVTLSALVAVGDRQVRLSVCGSAPHDEHDQPARARAQPCAPHRAPATLNSAT
jgi:hypothetical protein